MTYNQNFKLPLYAQLKEQLITMITNGQYKPGDKLPTQRDLVSEFDASHMTVRRAISELLNEGIIYAIPGKGLYVSEAKQVAETSPLLSFTEDMQRRGMIASSKMLHAQLYGASTIFASLFNIDMGSQLVVIRRLRLADKIPIAVQTTYLRHSLCPGILDFDLERNSLYRILRERYGLCLSCGKVSIEAILADSETALLLQTKLPASLLVTEQFTYNEDDQVIEYVRSAYRGDHYRMSINQYPKLQISNLPQAQTDNH